MQSDAANKLYVIMALTERALGRFAHSGESFGQQVIKALALCVTFFILVCL